MLSLLCLTIAGGQMGINFTQTSVPEALVAAKRLHKPVFVDAYANWCAPCREMKATTFRDKRITAYFNSHYVNAAINIDKGAGRAFAEQYQITTYPTLLWLDEQGKIIRKVEGFIDAERLYKMLNSK